MCFTYRVFTVSTDRTYNIICLCLLILLNYAKSCRFTCMTEGLVKYISSDYILELPFCLDAVLMSVFHIVYLFVLCFTVC